MLVLVVVLVLILVLILLGCQRVDPKQLILGIDVEPYVSGIACVWSWMYVGCCSLCTAIYVVQGEEGGRRELVVVVATMAMAKTMAMAMAKMLACDADGD